MFIKTEKVNSIYTDDTWRAVCGESRTHGEEEGNRKSTWNEKVTRLLPILPESLRLTAATVFFATRERGARTQMTRSIRVLGASCLDQGADNLRSIGR